MQQYFADTWYFIAWLDRRDAHHRDAVHLHERHGAGGLVTHDGVLMELLAYFAGQGSHARNEAAGFVRELVFRADVVATNRALFAAALDRYAARPDKEYSLVDCMSMIVMEERGIRHVLTNDHHFTQAGFTVVSQ